MNIANIEAGSTLVIPTEEKTPPWEVLGSHFGRQIYSDIETMSLKSSHRFVVTYDNHTIEYPNRALCGYEIIGRSYPPVTPMTLRVYRNNEGISFIFIAVARPLDWVIILLHRVSPDARVVERSTGFSK